MTEITPIKLVPTPIVDFPHAFPAGHRMSKAWRRNRMNKVRPRTLKGITFFIFVIDEDFGCCKLTYIRPQHVTWKKKGPSFHFQCGYPRTQVVIFAAENVADDDVQAMFTRLHESMKSNPTYSMWLEPGEPGVKLEMPSMEEMHALCSDTFAKEDDDGTK